MLAAHKQWWFERQMLEYKLRQEKKEQIAAAIIIIGSQWEDSKKRSYTKKKFWVHPLFQLREQHGFYEALFPTLASCDAMFKDYMRMSFSLFQKLLDKVEPIITRKYVVRCPISAASRLAMTLRYLATGDCITSTTYSYLVGYTTAIDIITETNKVLWRVLQPEVLPGKLLKKDWLRIAAGYKRWWHFCRCIGAIDGKHIELECPVHAGSEYYNYKSYHSIHLLGMCDWNYNFTFVDIGAPGRASDGGVFKNSLLGQKFESNKMNLPPPKKLMVDGNPMPYVLVGDEAFQLTHYLLRPYSARVLTPERRVFNYRLSRARRTIENTFGILVQRWRVLKKPLECCVKNTVPIVQACVVLHNWVRANDKENYLPRVIDNDKLKQELKESALTHANLHASHFSAKTAMDNRDEFCSYVNGEGAVDFQYNLDYY